MMPILAAVSHHTPRLINIFDSRRQSPVGNGVLIAGHRRVNGNSPKQGNHTRKPARRSPRLGGKPDTLADPILTTFPKAAPRSPQNDNWSASSADTTRLIADASASAGAFALPFGQQRTPAMLITLQTRGILPRRLAGPTAAAASPLIEVYEITH